MSSPRSACPLPGRCDRARITRHDRHVERADVDAKLEGVGGDNAAHVAIAKTALDLAPAQRQIAAAVAANHILRPGRARERVLHIRREDFRGKPALRKHDELKAALQEFDRHSSCFRQI